MEKTGRQVMLDNIVESITAPELEYLVKLIGIDRLEGTIAQMKDASDDLAGKRQRMPESLNIDGVVYHRRRPPI